MSVMKNESPQTEANGEALPKESDPPVSDGKLSPREHAVAAGLIKQSRGVLFGGESVHELRSPEFRAASTLHGWEAHEFQTGEPLRITREAFDAAIEAVKDADKRGNYAPHEDALAPHLKGGAK